MYPIPIRSTKCGVICRVNRDWTYISVAQIDSISKMIDGD